MAGASWSVRLIYLRQSCAFSLSTPVTLNSRKDSIVGPRRRKLPDAAVDVEGAI
jgi:hypothetical protein